MISLIDKCVPPARRDTVRALAGEIDQAIGGFVRGQSALSLVLALFYAVTLSMIGLKHGVLEHVPPKLNRWGSMGFTGRSG